MGALPEFDDNMRAAADQVEGAKSLLALDKSRRLSLAINPERLTLYYSVPAAKGDSDDLDTLARFLTRAFPGSLQIIKSEPMKQLTVVSGSKEIFDQLAAPAKTRSMAMA